ncbi:MAG: hypothetical protein RMK16_05440, partial [Acidobacteriota bacterium]|nr:hypothetical protein [Acidobacteriota bacterium]
MDEARVIRLLRAVASLDAEEGRRRWVEKRGRCIPLARFRTAVLRGDWTPEERRHLGDCRRCRRLESKVRAHVGHPNLKAIWDFLRRRLAIDVALDVRDHLWRDQCRRCGWAKAVLERLTVEETLWTRAAFKMVMAKMTAVPTRQPSRPG